MKLGFNEANDRFCANHSVMMDLEPVSYTHLDVYKRQLRF